MVSMIVTLKVQPGKEAQVISQFGTYAREVLKEPGARRFELFRSTNDPQTFLSYEQYVDQAAVEAHRNSPQFQAFMPGLGALLAGGVEMHVYNEPS